MENFGQPGTIMEVRLEKAIPKNSNLQGRPLMVSPEEKLSYITTSTNQGPEKDSGKI